MSHENLPKCDCLNHCGDDPWLTKNKAAYCDDFKDREKRAALTEVIIWTLVEDRIPDKDHVVLGFNQDTMKPINECYFDGDCWRFNDTKEIWVGSPVAWAPLPFGPRNTPWLSVRRAA